MRPLDLRLLPHLAPARGPLAGVVVAAVTGGALLVAQAFAVAWLVTALLDGPRSGDWTGAHGAAALLAGVLLGRALAGWAADTCAARASTLVTTAVRRRLLAAALSLGTLGLSRHRNGELALLATRGVTAVDPYLTRYLPALVVAGVLPPLTVAAIATQDPLSAVIVLATLPLVPVFAALVGMATRDRAERQWRALSTLSGHFVDVMRGLPTLVAHRRAKAQSSAIRAVTDRYRRATNETLRLAFASSAVLELVATISVALVAVTVGLRLSGGSLDLRTALVVLLLAPEAYWPLRRVGAEFHAAAEGTATFEAADRLIATAGSSSGTDPRPGRGPAPEGETGTAVTEDAGGGQGPARFLHGVVVDAVSVGYPDRPGPVLAGLSTRIRPRGLTAVTGPSGAGKSTLLAALMGELPLTEGAITVDGVDVHADLPAWQAAIAWMPQRPWIVAGTVADNVRLGRPGATDAEVWAALERVALGEVVAALPGGLGEQLGEDGAGLSAGERARLALARVVVAERPLVLLDEPTAHLDRLTESVVAETLTWLAERSAVVVVAHRERLVRLADHVVEVPGPAPGPASTSPAATGTGRGPGPESPPPEETPGAARTPTVPDRTATSGHEGSGVRLAAGAVLGALAAASGVALTATAGWLIARAAEHPPVLLLMVAIVGVRTFGLARPALRYAERLVSHDVALRLLAQRRASVYDMLVPLAPGRLGRQRGDVLSAIVDDVDSLLDRHLRVRAPLMTFGIVSATAVGFATWVLPAAGLVTAAMLLAGGGLAFSVSRLGVSRAEPGYVRGRARLSDTVLQTLQGAPDLAMWQATSRALDAVDGASLEVGRAAGRSARATATGRALALAAAGLGMLGMAAVGAQALADATVSKPMVALMLLLPLALLEVTAPLADAAALGVRTRAADARLADLAQVTPAVTDPDRPLPLATPVGSLTLAHASAGWGEDTAFRDLTVELPPGHRLAVVGPSGSGKSTLVAVLLRFLDPVDGSYRLGPTDARDVPLDDVRRVVGLVDDDPHVFGSTLFENIRLARPEAGEAEVAAALRAAQLGPWLASLPRGLHTMLGDGYAHVSGGERARIGLARALLADQPVLVLDEPTAHLDSGTAAAVAHDLLSAAKGRTVVWITHGEAGLDRMDAVLDLGRTWPVPAAATAVHRAAAPGAARSGAEVDRTA